MCLRNTMRPFPSKEYLRQKCEDTVFGFETGRISTSTIEKDIAAMKEDQQLGYYAPIEYDRIRKGYFYTEADYSINGFPLSIEELEALKFAAVTLFQYRNISIFEYFKEAIDKIYTKLSLSADPDDPQIDRFVHFEKAAAEKGMEWLQPIYAAIIASKPIVFTYNNIYKKEEKEFTVVPYLLKENQNHWYVIGWYEKHNCYLTFSLDRILKLTAGDKREKIRADFDPEKFFQYSSGIMEGTNKPLKISIEVKEPASKLLLLQPLHHTQKISGEKNGVVQFTLEVVESPELIRQLLAFGSALRVLKPQSLLNAMKEEALRLVENYGANNA